MKKLVLSFVVLFAGLLLFTQASTVMAIPEDSASTVAVQY